MEALKEQPAPVANKRPAVWDLVIEDMKGRDQTGLARYGTRLQPFNGRKALQDLYEELLDAVVYTRQKIEEVTRPKIDTVFLDMDGLLVNFVGGALAAHHRPDATLTAGEWHIAKSLGLTEKEFWAPLQGIPFWAELQPMPDMSQILAIIHELFGLQRCYLLSTPCLDDACYTGKALWVEQHLPDFQRRLILATQKFPLARPGALLIDDSDNNVRQWRLCGGDAILLPRLWNSHHHSMNQALAVLELSLQSRRDQQQFA